MKCVCVCVCVRVCVYWGTITEVFLVHNRSSTKYNVIIRSHNDCHHTSLGHIIKVLQWLYFSLETSKVIQESVSISFHFQDEEDQPQPWSLQDAT